MSTSVPAEMHPLLSKSIAVCFGLHFPQERWPELGKRIAAVAGELGYRDAAPFAARLLSQELTSEEMAAVAKSLTVGETYFFRDPQSYQALERHVLPEFIRERRCTRKELRIWSAGCSSGEEAYSIAVVVRRLIPDIHSWKVLILATDINHEMLRKAEAGAYTRWSFRNLPEPTRDLFCRRNTKGTFEVLPEYRKMVTFAHLNLASDPFPSVMNNTVAMDIIFCRNVLMYLTPETIQETISRFHEALADDGWFLSSPAEASLVDGSKFVQVNLAGTILYRKRQDSSGASGLLSGSAPFKHPDSDGEPCLAASTLTVNAPVMKPASSPPAASAPPAAPATEAGISPNEPDLYQMALVCYRHGRYAEAEQSLLKVLDSAACQPSASRLLCRVYADQGKLDAALNAVEKCLAADRLNPGAHYLKANILDEMGKTEDARASLAHALFLDPDFVLAHFALGNIALREGRRAQAEKSFENVVALSRERAREELLPESDGMTAGALLDMVASISLHLRDVNGGTAQNPYPFEWTQGNGVKKKMT